MTRKLKINLALQGGGAHGAFTWGALDRLLEEPDLEILGISGTSAGALNAAALKSGMIAGGAQGARDALDALWDEICGEVGNGVSQWFGQSWLTSSAISQAINLSAPFMMADTLSRMSTPYTWGPFYNNPLLPIVSKFNYDKVCADQSPALFIGATNVRTGKIKVFEGDKITADAILASACLPTLFQAVEIEGEAYWDGGYTGNPALFPLYGADLPDDIVVININPLERVDIPRSAQEIQNRINEISFNSSLLRELRAIAFVQRLLATGALNGGSMKSVNVHMIADDALMNELSVATKMIAVPEVVGRMKQAGRRAAGRFLDEHKALIGVRSSVDLPEMFQ